MRVLGFPVHVRRGFLFFMLLIVVLYGDEFGVWLAASIAAFTLLHELGHAVAARRAGATAEISLDFLAGYASYTSPRPLSRGAEAAIALAGPVTHVVAGFAVLFAMGVDPLDAASRGSSPAPAAVWWAGPVIGAFNLLPVLPLDGGNVVTSALERVLPGRARTVMVYASVAVTVAGGGGLRLQRQTRGFVVFLGLLLVMQLQALFAERDRNAVSPFDAAAAALGRGDDVEGAADPGQGAAAAERRCAPRRERSTPTCCAGCSPCSRDRCPTATRGTSTCSPTCWCATAICDEAARYGAESYSRNPQPMLAATVARAAGALGDEDTAVAWLRAAADGGRAPRPGDGHRPGARARPRRAAPRRRRPRATRCVSRPRLT